MPRMKGGLLLVVLMMIASACASRAGVPGSGRSQSDPITVSEIQQRGPFTNMYDLVQVLRPRWLRAQGPDSFVAGQGAVQVHIDGNWLGNVAALRGLAAHGVTSVRWLGPVDAAARYGLDHGHGAIVVSTGPVH
jgi:hypothetical protein